MRTIMLLVALALLGACGTVQVKATGQFPPKATQVRQHQVIVVLPLGGRYGPSARRSLEQEIVASRFHNMVQIGDEEGNTVNAALSANPDARPLVGNLPQGTGAVVSGVIVERYVPTESSSDVQRCVAKDAKGRCTKQVPVRIYSLTQQCTVDVQLRISSVTSGAIVSVTGHSGTASVSDQRDNERPAANVQRVCQPAFASAWSGVSRWVVPHTLALDLPFHKVKGDSGMTDEAIKTFAGGNTKDALDLFKAIPDERSLDDENRAWARHNLSLYHLSRAEFAPCVEQSNMAGQTLSSESDVKSTAQFCKEYL